MYWHFAFLRTRNPIGFCQRCSDTAKNLRSVNDVLICNNYGLRITDYEAQKKGQPYIYDDSLVCVSEISNYKKHCYLK